MDRRDFLKCLSVSTVALFIPIKLTYANSYNDSTLQAFAGFGVPSISSGEGSIYIDTTNNAAYIKTLNKWEKV